MEKRKYKANFVKYETINGHTEFIVKFTPEENAKSFYIRDRYSSMRNYWNDLTSKYKKEVTSTFPPKKFFGSNSPEFIKQRMKELEHFFNGILNDSKLSECQITLDYIRKKQIEYPKDFSNINPKKETKLPIKQELKLEVMVKDNKINEKKMQAIIDKIVKEYIDISYGEEPPPLEEVNKKTQLYTSDRKSVG